MKKLLWELLNIPGFFMILTAYEYRIFWLLFVGAFWISVAAWYVGKYKWR